MAGRPGTFLAACLMLLTTVPAAMGHGGVGAIETPVGNVSVDDQQETRIELDVEGTANEIGRWLPEIEAEVPAVNMALLPGGEILYYSGVEANESADNATQFQFFVNATPLHGRSRVMSLDIADDGSVLSKNVTTPNPEKGYPEDGGYDIFCSATTVTPDGQALAPGATRYYTFDRAPENAVNWPLQGWNQSLAFDADSNEWIPMEAMDVGRWYPSALQLPSGDTLVASGIQSLFYSNTYNTLLETYDPDQPSKGWQNLNTSFQPAPGVTIDDDELPDTPDTGVDPVDQTHQGVPNLPMYPRLHVIPAGPHQGEVLYTANGDTWGPFGHHPVQPLWGLFQTLDTDSGTWTVHEGSAQSLRHLGTTVPLMIDADDPQPRYLSFGGTFHQSTQATPTAEIIDATGDTIQSTPTEPMQFPRWSLSGILLPDGSVLALGGSTYDNVVMHGQPNIAPLNAERFTPDGSTTGGSWELLPGMNDSRAYHHTALLLPDGRVAIGGHVPLPAFHDTQRETYNPQPRDTTFQLYEPAYLHHEDEDRPSIKTNATITTRFGDTVRFQVTGLDTLDSVTLLRPGAATHSYTADQMGVELTVDKVTTQSDGAKIVEANVPSQDDLALAPGHYMAFVNEDANGDEAGGFYPSEAAWVNILEPGEDASADTGASGDEAGDENESPGLGVLLVASLVGLAAVGARIRTRV